MGHGPLVVEVVVAEEQTAVQVGLTVVISGSDADRVEAFGAACIDADAERVLTFVHEHHAAGARIVHTTDTKEGIRWPN